MNNAKCRNSFLSCFWPTFCFVLFATLQPIFPNFFPWEKIKGGRCKILPKMADFIIFSDGGVVHAVYAPLLMPPQTGSEDVT